jgi:uncharacterized protein (TIGR02001 family)
MFHRCKWLPIAAVAAFGFDPALSQPVESRLHLSIAVMSDYKHNGLSQSGSDAAARFAADYEHRSGFFAGGFVSKVEYAAEYRYQEPRDLQTNVYAGYLWRSTDWTANATLSRYLYPDAPFDYDYTLAAVNVSFRDRFFFGASYASDFLSIERSAHQYRAGTVFPWTHGIEIGVNAGRFRASDLPRATYSFWDIGLSRALGGFALDLRYHGNSYDGASILGEGDGDRWVFSASYAIRSRARPEAPR